MIDVMYDTYIDKGYGHIDEIKALADQGSEEQKMPYYALLADMYRNKGEFYRRFGDRKDHYEEDQQQ